MNSERMEELAEKLRWELLACTCNFSNEYITPGEQSLYEYSFVFVKALLKCAADFLAGGGVATKHWMAGERTWGITPQRMEMEGWTQEEEDIAAEIGEQVFARLWDALGDDFHNLPTQGPNKE